MRKIAVAAALLLSSAAQAQTAYDELPLDKGNLSVFIEDSAGYLQEPTQIRTVEVTEGGYYGYGWFHHVVSGLYRSDVELWDHYAGNQLWTYSDDWYRAFDFDAPRGGEYSYRIGPCERYNVTYNPLGASILTPAGKFNQTRSHELAGAVDPWVRCMGPTLTHISTAQNVGVVSYVDGERKGHLLYARVGGAVVASGPRSVSRQGNLETTMVVPETGLYHGDAAASFQVALIVTNHSDADEMLFFGSGQKIEIDVFDAEGIFIRSLSTGRVFTQATEQVRLAPGASEVYYGVVPATFEDGTRLDGVFQIVAYIKANGMSKNAIDVAVK